MNVTFGGDYYEHIISEGARGWRVSVKQTQKYITRLAELEQQITSGKKVWLGEVKELKLKIEHWGTFEEGVR